MRPIRTSLLVLAACFGFACFVIPAFFPAAVLTPGGGSRAALWAADEINYEPLVEITKIQVNRAPGKARQFSVELTFNLAPEAPKGLNIHFQLLQQGIPLEEVMVYTLASDVRKNLKFTLAPKESIGIDTYFVRAKYPVEDQTPEVQKALEAKPKRFPPESTPWGWDYQKQEFKVGTEADEAEEFGEFKAMILGHVEKLTDLHGSGVGEVAKASGGAVNKDKLKTFFSKWMKDVGAIQAEMATFPDRQPGLYRKYAKTVIDVVEYGRMVGRHVMRQELDAVLKKNNLTQRALQLPPNSEFDAGYRYKVTPTGLVKKVDLIKEFLVPASADPKIPPAPPEEGDPAKGEGSKEDGGAKPEGDKAGDGEKAEPKDEGKEQDAEPASDEEEKPAESKKKGSKNTKKKSKKS